MVSRKLYISGEMMFTKLNRTSKKRAQYLTILGGAAQLALVIAIFFGRLDDR